MFWFKKSKNTSKDVVSEDNSKNVKKTNNPDHEDKKWIKLVQAWIFRNLAWISILIALICFIVSGNKVFERNINDIFEKAGLAMLSSGVFAAILKSLQFSGIFRDEIAKVMSGMKFIENRNDLPEVWKVVSKMLYKRKFPKIGSLLEDTILNSYFPTKSKFYYENYHVSIFISEITEKFELVYTQTCNYTVILDDNENSCDLCLNANIADDDDETTTLKNDLVLFEVDSVLTTLTEDASTIGNTKKTLYKHKLSGNKNFEVKHKFERRIPLKNENYKLFRLNNIAHNMHVSVSFPEDVRVSFFEIGLLGKFEKINEDFKNHICRVLNNQLILRNQGFGLSFEKIKQ